MVMYALHHSWLTKSMSAKIDSWQVRMLRRVLRIKASMISRVSNAEVLKKAHCTPMSNLIRGERFKYFGHVLRREFPATIQSVCVDASCKLRPPAGKRRQKRPLDNWTRKVTAEVLVKARHSLPLVVRPSDNLRPATTGLLYARRIAENKHVWEQLHRRTQAPAGRPTGACPRPGRGAAALVLRPPGGAG